MISNRQMNNVRSLLLAAGSLSALMIAVPASAQSTTPAASQDASPAEQEDAGADIVVQGYRASLVSATMAKKNAAGFSDSIFAEDIGKFPDTNIAESLNRVPGVTISRDITGEGQQVTIRGLGTNFTRVLLNNAPIAVASTGRDGAQSTNREVDLDVFPTELFTSLTVNKSSVADMLEGGAAGTVNLRSARPFDKEGTRVTYSGQTTNISNTGKWGYRGSVLASTTMGDFGVLVGFAGVRNQVNVNGYETIGLTNPNLSAAQFGASTGANATGGGNFTIPGTVPSNAGIPGVAAGTVIDRAFLLAHNPGANIGQIDNGLLPRLGRPMSEFGTKDRISFIGSLEYKGDSLHAYVDGMYSKKNNDLRRVDMNWVGRNGAIIPVNTQYDRSDCSAGCVVTKGTYYNAQFFLEYRPFIEDTSYWGVNPGIEWEATDTLKFNLNGNYTKSKFHREVPTVLVSTLANSGVTVEFDNTAGGIPDIKSNINLNDPTKFGWPGGRVNIQDEYRTTETKGVRGDLTWGDTHLNVKVGAAYDDVSRSITATDNSQAFQNAVCGNRPNVFLPSPNTQPPCDGLNTPTPGAGYPTYPALGTGFSTGTGALSYGGSLIPNSALPGYLQPGSFGFITVDWDKFKKASNYDAFHDASPAATGSNTGASGGYVREKTLGVYGEVNGDLQIASNRLTFNAGLRWVKTDQRIGGYVSISDPRNSQDPDGAGPLPAACPGTGNPRDGSCYPNLLNFVYTGAKYDNWLPSFTTAFHVGEKAVLRMAVSRTMTRPNPSSMLPGLSFSSPSADVGSVGNPSLQPFISTNIDFGAEYYTGQEGYIGIAAFQKDVTGFTVNGNVTVPFSALGAYGVTFDTLSPTQQLAINSRGGPAAATVVLTQQVNASGVLTVKGLEGNWVQPLDFLLGRYLGLNGFGFSANVTLIDQKGSGAAPAIATGIAPTTYNITAYYERGGISARLSTTFTEGFVASGTNQNGIPAAALYNDDYQQWDFGSSLDLGEIFGNKRLPSLTFDVQNIFKARQRSYFQFANATYTDFNPGRQVMLGLRGRF
jgi:TonB-dependent receptor